MDMTASDVTPFARKTPSCIPSSAAPIRTKTAPAPTASGVKSAENVSQVHHVLSGKCLSDLLDRVLYDRQNEVIEQMYHADPGAFPCPKLTGIPINDMIDLQCVSGLIRKKEE